MVEIPKGVGVSSWHKGISGYFVISLHTPIPPICNATSSYMMQILHRHHLGSHDCPSLQPLKRIIFIRSMMQMAALWKWNPSFEGFTIAQSGPL